MPVYEFYCDNEGCPAHKDIFDFEYSMTEMSNEVKPPCSLCNEAMKRKYRPVRRVYKKHAGQFLDPDMNETQAEDALYEKIEESND